MNETLRLSSSDISEWFPDCGDAVIGDHKIPQVILNDKLMTDAIFGTFPIKAEHSYSLTSDGDSMPDSPHDDDAKMEGKQTFADSWNLIVSALAKPQSTHSYYITCRCQHLTGSVACFTLAGAICHPNVCQTNDVNARMGYETFSRFITRVSSCCLRFLIRRRTFI